MPLVQDPGGGPRRLRQQPGPAPQIAGAPRGADQALHRTQGQGDEEAFHQRPPPANLAWKKCMNADSGSAAS